MYDLDLTPEQLELYALSSFRDAETLRKAIESGIDEISFSVDKHAKVWEYLLDKSKLGITPTLEDIKAVTGVSLFPDVTDVDTFLSELTRITQAKKILTILEDTGDMISREPAKAAQKIIGEFSELVKNASAHSRYFDADIDTRYAKMVDRVNKVASGEVIGISTGLQSLDNIGATWRPGEVISIQGPLNIGKSTLLLYFCAHAYFFSEKKILFLTPESTIDDVQDRLDPFIGRFMNFNLSNTKLRSGTVDLTEYRTYLDNLESFGRKDWITRDSGDAGVFSVAEIVQLAREHRPDILAIDGVHLISGQGQTWERMKAAAETIKGIAQHLQCVVIGGTQVTRDAVASSDEVSGLAEGAYGLAFAEAADKVISLSEKRGDSLQRVYKLIKHRSGPKLMSKQYIRFDVDSGEIRDMGINVSDSGEIDFD